jgi:TonB family protein
VTKVFSSFAGRIRRTKVAVVAICAVVAGLWWALDVFPVTPDFLREVNVVNSPRRVKKKIEIQDIVKSEPAKVEMPDPAVSQRPNLDTLKPQMSSALRGFGEGSGGFGGDFSEDGGVGREAKAAVENAAIERLAKVVKKVDPRFPQNAREKNISGSVLIEVSVSSGGQPVKLRVLDSQPPGVFDSSAVEALRAWVFEPAMNRGQPVASTVMQRLRFDLE